jgi:hypothetical protein
MMLKSSGKVVSIDQEEFQKSMKKSLVKVKEMPAHSALGSNAR